MYFSGVRFHSWLRRACVLVLTLGVLAGIASAQDFRGAIGGRVTDESGAVLPGVTVTVTNKETNVSNEAVTNDTGTYSLLLSDTRHLFGDRRAPGLQESDARQRRRSGSGIASKSDFKLEVGRLEETVTVAAETPLLETRSGSAGQVIDEKQIALMPLSDGNPFVLARLAPGVAYHGDLKFSRPFDNGGTSDFTADGGPAATSSRSTARPTWPTAAAWRSCRRPAPCRSSRSRRRRSTPSRDIPPARR